jgi:hypothetical protein
VRRYGIYTDRCADLPQLLRLLARIARDTPDDPRFVSYALARAFTSRVADSYEARARAIATDIADGYPPERVRAFRKHLLSLQARPGLSSRLRERLEPMLSAVLPSLPLHAPASGAVSLAVGPAPLLDAYERELQASQGPQARLLRIYPRDFWFVGSLGSAAGRRPSPPAVPPSSPSLSR